MWSLKKLYVWPNFFRQLGKMTHIYVMVKKYVMILMRPITFGNFDMRKLGRLILMKNCILATHLS